MTDDQATGAAPGPDGTATTKIPRPSVPDSAARPPADDFAPDVPAETVEHEAPEPANGTAPMPMSGRPPADYGGDPTREAMAFAPPREPAIESATSDEDVHLIPGASIVGGPSR